MAAVLTSEIENAEKLAFLITACREMGIKVLPPDINSSGISFSVDSGKIRFGLGAIKGMGEVAASKIIESREKDGVFTSFLDFCERCGADVNSRTLEHLTRAGALDGLGLRRSQILAIAEPMMAFAQQRAKDKAAGQGSLFDLLGGNDDPDDACSIPIPDIPEFDWDDILKTEKELLGFYVSGHPLDPCSELVNIYGTPIRTLGEMEDGTPLRLAGMVSSFTKKISKINNKPFGILSIEDFDASCECMVYERALKSMETNQVSTAPGTPLLLEITVNKRDENERPRVVVENVLPLTEASAKFSEEIYLHVYEDKISPAQQAELAELARKHPGNVKLIVCLVRKDNSVIFVEAGFDVAPDADFIAGVLRILGRNSFEVKVIPPKRPAPKRWKKPDGEGEEKQDKE
jgi:DNA polymerase-3 subunit alpha